MAIEELLHRFGCKTEATELEVHQGMEEGQKSNSELAKEMHAICQYVIVKLARCISRLDLLEQKV